MSKKAKTSKSVMTPNAKSPALNMIMRYLHCKKCIEEFADPKIRSKLGNSPMSAGDYQSIEVGWTPQGIQIWCKRHDENIIHLDFKGQKVSVI